VGGGPEDGFGSAGPGRIGHALVGPLRANVEGSAPSPFGPGPLATEELTYPCAVGRRETVVSEESKARRSRVPSSAAWVQIAQALVARELVEGLGLTERPAAALLGIVPSSVSQYLSGKRLGSVMAAYRQDPEARRIARRTADRLAARTGSGSEPELLLETAIRLSRHFASRAAQKPSRSSVDSEPERIDPSLRRWIRRRTAAEQEAVAQCMRLAQKSRDELTRAIFRQIASDSLRHAEIVGSLGSYLDRGIRSPAASGITVRDVEQLIARERAAEARDDPEQSRAMGGLLSILWESMEFDERKHDRLLELLRVSAKGSHGDAGASS
jgi:predicted transcriptional regulator